MCTHFTNRATDSSTCITDGNRLRGGASLIGGQARIVSSILRDSSSDFQHARLRDAQSESTASVILTKDCWCNDYITETTVFNTFQSVFSNWTVFLSIKLSMTSMIHDHSIEARFILLSWPNLRLLMVCGQFIQTEIKYKWCILGKWIKITISNSVCRYIVRWGRGSWLTTDGGWIERCCHGSRKPLEEGIQMPNRRCGLLCPERSFVS